MQRELPWPFEGGRFPRQLGAVVMRTVLEGRMPALQVVHFPDGGWGITDGVNDPNERDACVATHIRHVLERDETLHELASLPPGFEANRDRPGDPWRISGFEYAEPPFDRRLIAVLVVAVVAVFVLLLWLARARSREDGRPG